MTNLDGKVRNEKQSCTFIMSTFVKFFQVILSDRPPDRLKQYWYCNSIYYEFLTNPLGTSPKRGNESRKWKFSTFFILLNRLSAGPYLLLILFDRIPRF